MKVIAFYNLKGGVGKTAAAVNLASLAATEGHTTLLWDLDPQGSSSWYFGERLPDDTKLSRLIKGKTPIGPLIVQTTQPHLSLIPSGVSVRNMDAQLEKHGHPQVLRDWLAPLSESYSLIVLDCPPSLSRLAENVFSVADAVYVPIIPTWLSMHTWEQLLAFAAEKKLDTRRFRPFLSMVDRRKRLHREFLEHPPEIFRQPLNGYVPYASEVERMGEFRLPLHAFAPRCAAALAYQLMWEQVAAQLGLRAATGTRRSLPAAIAPG